LCGWKLRGSTLRNKHFEDELKWSPFESKNHGIRADILVNEDGEKFIRWCILNGYMPAFVTTEGDEDEA
jgi:hypothetical protein